MTVKRKVTKVIDGDTFVVDKPVRGSNYIRMTGRDTPEKGERGYASAKKTLREQIEDKIVEIDPKAKSYGRTVADVKRNGKKL